MSTTPPNSMLQERAENCISNIDYLMQKLHGQLEIAELLIGEPIEFSRHSRNDLYDVIKDVVRSLDMLTGTTEDTAEFMRRGWLDNDQIPIAVRRAIKESA